MSLLRLASLFIVGLLTVLAIAGATYEAIASARDYRLYPPPGKLVDVGGRRLHIHCTGAGSPAVILDAGLCDFSSYWLLVQPDVAKFTQVCSYDRAGLGWSDPDPVPRIAHRITSDLDALLTRTVPSPYILVGHSGGGYWCRVYTSEHPDKVVGSRVGGLRSANGITRLRLRRRKPFLTNVDFVGFDNLSHPIERIWVFTGFVAFGADSCNSGLEDMCLWSSCGSLYI